MLEHALHFGFIGNLIDAGLRRRFGNHLGGALHACTLIHLQSVGHRVAALERARQHRTVFNRHGRALGQKRQRGMGGIAQQGGAGGAPVVDRGAVVERPAIALGVVHRIEDGLHLGMPAGIGGLEFLPGPDLVPGFVLPGLVRRAADKVEQVARAQPVDHGMVLRPAPHRADQFHDVLG